MKRLFLASAACLVLAACSATAPEPRIETKIVEVAVPVPCKPNLGPDPVYPDTDEALRSAPNLFERVKLLAAGRLMRIARDAEKSAALDKCAG